MGLFRLCIIGAVLGQDTQSQWSPARTTPHAFIVQLQNNMKPACLGFMKDKTTLVAPASCASKGNLAVKAVPKKHKRNVEFISAPIKVNRATQPMSQSGMATFRVDFKNDIKLRKVQLSLFDIEDSLDQNGLMGLAESTKLSVYRFDGARLVSRPYRLVNGAICQKALKNSKTPVREGMFCVRAQAQVSREPLIGTDLGAPLVAYSKQSTKRREYSIAGMFTHSVKLPKRTFYVFAKPSAAFNRNETITTKEG